MGLSHLEPQPRGYEEMETCELIKLWRQQLEDMHKDIKALFEQLGFEEGTNDDTNLAGQGAYAVPFMAAERRDNQDERQQ